MNRLLKSLGLAVLVTIGLAPAALAFDLREDTASQEWSFVLIDNSSSTGAALSGETIPNTEIKLVKPGGTSETNKNSGGATEIGTTGRYYVTFDATDSDTAGSMVVVVRHSGALEKEYVLNVLTQTAYDFKYATGLVPADVQALSGGDSGSADDLKDFADTGYDPATHKVQGVVTVDTTTTNSDMRGTDNAALASAYTSARAGYLDNLNIGEDVAGTSQPLDAAGVRSAVGLASANLDTQIATISGSISGTAQTATHTTTSVVLASGQVVNDNNFKNWTLTITSGDCANQSGRISASTASSDTVTLAEALEENGSCSVDADLDGATYLLTPPGVAQTLVSAGGLLDTDCSGHTTNSTLGAICNDWEANGRLDTVLAAASTFDPTTDVVLANFTKVLGTSITETTGGRLADNMSTFWDNADADTTKVVDDVGSGSGSGDWGSTEKNQIRKALGVTGTTAATSGSGNLDAVKAKTDNLTFTTANKVDARVDYVGGSAVTSPDDMKADVTNLDAAVSTRATPSQVSTQVAAQLDTAIGASPTAGSINERIKTLDDNYTASRAGNLDDLDATVSSRSSFDSTTDPVILADCGTGIKFTVQTDAGNSATSVVTDLTDANYDTDNFGGASIGKRSVVFKTGSAIGKGATIQSFNATTHALTFDSVGETPSDGSVGCIF